jgi:hypothetical protein
MRVAVCEYDGERGHITGEIALAVVRYADW